MYRKSSITINRAIKSERAVSVEPTLISLLAQVIGSDAATFRPEDCAIVRAAGSSLLLLKITDRCDAFIIGGYRNCAMRRSGMTYVVDGQVSALQEIAATWVVVAIRAKSPSGPGRAKSPDVCEDVRTGIVFWATSLQILRNMSWWLPDGLYERAG